MASKRTASARALLAFASAFVLFQFAFHEPFARWFPHARDVEYAKKLTRLKQIASEKPSHRPLVVAFGSSLTAMGFCPAAFDNSPEPQRAVCYNFAINASGVVVQQLSLRRILAEGIRPDVATIELSPYFLTRRFNTAHNGDCFPVDRVQGCDFPVLNRYHADAGRMRGEWLKQQAVPWWSYRNNLQQWAYPDSTPKHRRMDQLWRNTDSRGWEFIPDLIALHGAYYLYPEPCRALREFWRSLTEGPFDFQMEAAFGELVQLCNENGIRPVVILMPESSHLRESYHATGRHRCSAIAAWLRDVHGAEIVDARDWLMDEHFIEGLHMNPNGSHVYSLRLNRDFLRKFRSNDTASR